MGNGLWGPLGSPTKEQIQEYVNMPYGKFTELVREHDPKWGKEEEEGKKKTYKVKLSALASCYAHAKVTVEACSEDEAADIALEKVDNPDFKIDKIEEIEVKSESNL